MEQKKKVQKSRLSRSRFDHTVYLSLRSRPILAVWYRLDDPQFLVAREEGSVDYARRFYKFGFALLPWLWAVNCFYFWPVLRHSRSFPQIRKYVVRSAIGFSVFTALLSAWALTFSIGGEQLFGPVWDKLVMYNVADRLGLSGLA
ncbi:unnamed protein product [Arabis nemorensis]|uniref:Gamma-secretase subunit PEN-2 n=1 Tax=Arabis nemorensis TaxID=586526 RepID=A0A565CJL9_9BRAS|nr:unnamed protein product [Arabis nemorensis]